MIVAHADNLFAGNRRLKVRDIIETYRKRGLNDAAERIGDLHRKLSAIVGMDIDDIQ